MLETRALFAATVASLTLVNADTDRDVMALTNGAVVDVAQIGTKNLNVRANASSDTESVRFALDSNSNFRTENGAPYSLAGDASGGDYRAWVPALGSHTLKATPFAADSAKGTAGAALTVAFTVVNGTTPTPTPTPTPAPTAPAAASALSASAAFSSRVDLAWTDNAADETGFHVERSTDGTTFTRLATVGANVKTYADTGLSAGTKYTYRVVAYNGVGASAASNTASATTAAATTPPTQPAPAPTTSPYAVTTFTLVNADTDKDVMTLGDGATVDFAALGTTKLNVRANVTTGTKSVRFGLDADGSFRTESGAPFALAGDSKGNYNAWTPALGAHTLTGTAYSGTSAGGTKGATLTVKFTVVNGTTAPAPTPAPTPTPTPTPEPAPTTPAPATPARLVSPPQASVDAAIAASLVRHSRSYSGGFTSRAGNGGAPVTLAVASYAGNTRADARLLQQLRHSITGGNEIVANGGYPAQHETQVTVMFAVARQTPRVWDQLTAAEKKKVDLIMKGSLIANAFTTSDFNPFWTAKSQQYTLDGDSNVGRGWNPNYREGMIGGVLVASAYFGGGAAAEQVLKSYDHAAFVAELKAAGLTNMAATFNWREANPTSKAPTAAQIQATARKGYAYNGTSVTNTMGLYLVLAEHTYGATVNAGLNNGAGINGYGRLLSGADTLPNKGQKGMLLEFDSGDADGDRSSANYAYDGFRPHLFNQVALITGGQWDAGSSEAQAAVKLQAVGNRDLWYKLDKGYANYAKGAARGESYATATNKGYEFTRALWEQVVKPFHGLA